MAHAITTRKHFIYQFFILTLLYIVVGYYALLPDRKLALFLISLPMLGYQFIILHFCTELIPVQWYPTGNSVICSEKPGIGDSDSSNEEKDMSGEVPKPKAKVHKSYSWRINSHNANNSMHSPFVSLCSISQNNIIAKEKETGLFRKYSFKSSNQNRMRYQSLDINEDNELESKRYTPFTRTQPSPCFEIPEELDLETSYRFPSSRKNLDHDSSDEEFDCIPSMPRWENLNYSVSNRSERLKRKSISSSKLPSFTPPIQKQKEFSQSVELPIPLSAEIETSLPKTRLPFNKVRRGIVNCFSKLKRDSFKLSVTKNETRNVKKSIKKFLQSKRI